MEEGETPANILRLGSSVGKIDKQRELWLKNRNKFVVKITPKTVVERSISEINREINDTISTRSKLTLERAVTLYLNLRSNRHDIWVEYIKKSLQFRRPKYNVNEIDETEHNSFLLNDIKQDIGDVRVRTFIDKIRASFNIDIENPPDRLANLSPDLLFYNRRDGMFYLGDIAVSKDVKNVKVIKYNKYKPIETWLNSLGYKVVNIDTIIDETLTDVDHLMSHLERCGVIKPVGDCMYVAKEYHRTCMNDMNRVKDICDDASKFYSTLDMKDRITKGQIDLDLPDIDIDLTEYTPVNSEDEIISWVKNETDNIYEDYYDKDINDSLLAIDKVLMNKPGAEVKPPRSTLLVADNSYEHEPLSNHELVMDYVHDISINNRCDVMDYVLEMLPNIAQLKGMKEFYEKNRKSKDLEKKIYGPYQYSRINKTSNRLTNDLNVKLEKGKKIRNVKKPVTTIDSNDYQNCIGFIDSNIMKYGDRSMKTPFLNDTWGATSNFEMEQSIRERDVYNYCRQTRGAQLAHSLSNFYYRLTHMRARDSKRDNIYVPPNGAFLVVIPKEHAPVTNSKCDMPSIFITRYRITSEEESTCEYEHKFYTKRYVYYVSKLCRFDMNKISNWDQAGDKLVCVTSYLLGICPNLYKDKKRVVGILTYMTLDIHQKTSEYLDLLKYISYMPFSQLHRLSSLIGDKMDLIRKTKLDIWLVHTIKDFIIRLSDIDKLNAKKPQLHLFNGEMTRESQGLVMSLPSFMSNDIRHSDIPSFIEEVNTIFQCRPKHLYGSQFMDKSTTSTVDWNIEYDSEIVEHGDWVITGDGKGVFPFRAKFAFSSSAIAHAQKYFLTEKTIDRTLIEKKLYKEKYTSFMHNNCSLRGATKEQERRLTTNDLHTTSLDECLKEYKLRHYREDKCTAFAIANDFISSHKPMEFTMSEKDQRGGGRPIATPTLGTKAALMLIEKPEASIGGCVDNNIIVSGKNKLQEQSKKYKLLTANGAIRGYKQAYQLTEDQSKFSENDNTRKYINYIKNNTLLPPIIRKYQIHGLKKIIDREHLTKKLPKRVLEDRNRLKYANKNKNGVIATIGWPQGMLNFISTSVHSIADYWITYAYNKAYPDNSVMTQGLVHSDDSWVAVACNSLDDFKRFSIFRMLAKKLFCLKLNEKKLWGSSYLGELVSNYNINGNVHLSVTKTVTNSFNNLMYQNWVIDVNTQISCIQQAYRNGADIPTLILIATIMKQQILRSYQVRGAQLKMLNMLPIELGGYPATNVLALAMCGVQAHYSSILDEYTEDPEADWSIIVSKCMTLSVLQNKGHKLNNNYRFFKFTDQQKKFLHDRAQFNRDGDVIGYVEKEEDDEVDDQWGNKIIRPIEDRDYESLSISGRGDIFTCVKHIMPKSNKLTKTIQELRSLPFESNGISMIVTRPLSLKEALGDLREQTNTLVYQLASEHYTQSARRLAVSQAIQSSGKTVRIGELKPMTINEMLHFLRHCDEVRSTHVDNLKIAFTDDSDVPKIAIRVSTNAEYMPTDSDKRKIINKIPLVDKKYDTVCKLKNVLLKLIDNCLGTSFYFKYTNSEDVVETLESDIALINKRFMNYFQCYQVKYACNLIMQQSLSVKSSRLWMQPYLRTDSLDMFISDLYGKTVNKELNYRVSTNYTTDTTINRTSQIVSTMYTAMVMNSLYKDHFVLESILKVPPLSMIRDIDPKDLSENDYAKYCVLYHVLTGHDDKLKSYEKNREYIHYYSRPQQWIKGKYVGNFECYVKYGRVIIRLVGEPGKMRIESNTNNVQDVTSAMMMFTQKNFSNYRYDHPAMWGQSEMWMPTDIVRSPLYLAYLSSSKTLIQVKRTNISIPIKIKPDLSYPVPDVVTTNYTYTYDESYRCIYRLVGEEKHKTITIKQNLEAPYSDSCVFISNFVDGIDNNRLFQTKAIMNIVLMRYYSVPKSTYRELLRTRLGGLTTDKIIDLYENICCQFTKGHVRDDPAEESPYVTEEYVIEPMTVASFLESSACVNAEDIDYLESHYVYETDDSPKKIQVYYNLYRIICKAYAGFLSQKKLEDLMWFITNDASLRNEIKEVRKMDEACWNEHFSELRTAATYLEEDYTEMLAFIVGNDLDKFSVVKGLKVVEVSRDRNRLLEYSNMRLMSNQFSHIITKELSEEDIPDSWDDGLYD